MAEPLVRMSSFSYRYPDAVSAVLREVDLELSEGEFVVLAGRSASGKSTLLRACCGLVPHYHGGEVAGELSICGLDVRDHGPAELGGVVGLVAQEPESQVVSATVRGELELPLELRGAPPAARARAIEEVSLALAIPHLLDRPTDTLSGGELQRVALAAALVLGPRLVLLDEPTSQLDPVAGDELVALLRRLNEEWGMGVILAEHRLERCLAAADRVLTLDSGAVVHDGSAHEFCDWAVAAQPTLAPPGARLFSLAGLRPLPVAAKEARRILRLHGIEPGRGDAPAPANTSRRRLRGVWRGGTGGGARGLDLTLRRGDRGAQLGRNGAGKPTLLRAPAGLIEPAAGAVSAPAGCALLPQCPADLFVAERVAEELPGAAGERALAAVGIEGVRDSDPRDLSGGERQRLALAIVMAGRAGPRAPGLVCLDEPTRGMDWARKTELDGWIAELASGGSAVLLATHDVEFAARFADRVVLLGAGELIADARPDEVLSGGWYFATEVARILGAEGATTPEAGARALGARLAPSAPMLEGGPR